jgi:predicted nucleotidyltransferase
MTQEEILAAFRALNDELSRDGIKAEVGVVGGAAMVLALNARKATRDVDAVFEPATRVRDAAARVAASQRLPIDWLNDAAKGYMPADTEPRSIILDLPHLVVWTPPLNYLLAMKAIAARFDSQDAQDLRTLVRHLGLRRVEQVLEVVEGYYPRNQIPAKTQFFLEELFEQGELGPR